MDIWVKLYKPRSKPILKKFVLSDCEGIQAGRQFVCRTFWSIQQSSKHSSWWRRLKDILKTCFVFIFRRRLAKISSRCFQNVSLSQTVQNVSEIYWKALIYRRICLGHTSEKFVVSVQTLQESQKFLKF